MSTISYVIPVYHNEGSIELTWAAIRDLFARTLPEHDYEIVFVNDGSKDDSHAEMLRVSAQDPRVRSISFTRNFGQLSATLAGFDAASGDAVINMSADMQDPVELTAEMIRKWEQGNEVVIAHRADREDNFTSSLFSRIVYGILRMSNPNMPAGGFDFTLMSRRALTLFMSMKGRHRFFQGDVLWAGFPTAYIPYVRRKREIGKSQYNFSKKLKLAFDFIIDGSYLPIRLMSLSGTVLAMLGLCYAVVIAVSRLFRPDPLLGLGADHGGDSGGGRHDHVDAGCDR
ncbi:TPA: glycosyltransferase family 2 protein [Stenotrophomonas maltophilia]|nr:glycosyltransferase family 2 protein [Stenotrophomonas maltophilia]